MKKLSLRLTKTDLITCVYAALAFLIPCAVMLFVLDYSEIYPFGEKSLLIMDMDNQYVEFYSALRQIASGENSVFFSWSKAMGTNFWGLFAYYLASPFSWLLLLFEDILVGIFFLTVFKLALCGWSSYLFFRSVFRIKPLSLLLFSTSYALMSYNMAYSLSLMWLDGVILLPLVLWGAERILRGKGPVPFILLLATAIVTQYYIAYIVALFTFFFVLYRYFSEKKADRLRPPLFTAGIFTASYAVALGLSLWMLLPVVYDLLNGKVGYPNYTPNINFNFSLIEYPLSFLPGRYSSITNSGNPILYGGLLVAALCLAHFFFFDTISLRRKIASLIMFLMLLCCFWLTKPDMVWHGFQYPNWFPYRYAFAYQFFAVFIAASGWETFSRRLKKEGRRSFPVWLKPVLTVLLLCFVCADMFWNAQALLYGLDRQFGYKEAAEYQEFQEENRAVTDSLQDTGDSFYRTEKTYQRSYNDAFSLNYNGITHYSSAFNQNIIRFTRDLGFVQTHFWNTYQGSTPVNDSLFGVKYVLTEDIPLPYPEHSVSGDITVHENPYVLPLGYMIEDAAELDLKTGNCFERQNRWLSQFSGVEQDVFVRLDTSDNVENRITFTAKSRKPVYAFVDVNPKPGGSIVVNDTRTIPYFAKENTGVVYLGQFKPGETVSVVMDLKETTENCTPYVYELQPSVLQAAVQELRIDALDSVVREGTRIHAELTASKSGTLFLSIPYDEGFTILVDGQKTGYTALNSTFILLPVSEGEHTIEIFFIPQGLVPGIALSLLFAMGLLMVSVMKRKKAATAFHIHPKTQKGGDAG